jgi:Cu2+-exporting ATPase
VGGFSDEVIVCELQTGYKFLVLPGASVPAVGVVIEGVSDVDEALVTCESKTVKK